MYKIIVFDSQMEVTQTIANIISYSPYLDKVDFNTSDEGKGSLEGFNGAYIVVPITHTEEVSTQELIDYTKSLKITELSNECEKRILEGFTFELDIFEFELKDQQNFNQQLSLLTYSEVDVTWKTLNNGIKVYPKAKFIEICFAGEQHKRSNISNYWNKKQEILNTEYLSISDLKKVTL